MVGAVEAREGVKLKNQFQLLECDDVDYGTPVMGVKHAKPLTRLSAIEFNVADVRKPLASAVKMVKANSRVVLDEKASCIQNKLTGECMEGRIEDETFVFDVEFDNGEDGMITLDSGAGVNVWPKGKMQDVKMMPKRMGLKMCAANGTEIPNYGRKVIMLRGVDSSKGAKEAAVFNGRV